MEPLPVFIKAFAHWLSRKGSRPSDRSPPPDFQPPFSGLQNKANFPPSLPLYRFQSGKQPDLTFAKNKSKHYWALPIKETANTELLQYARGASISFYPQKEPWRQYYYYYLSFTDEVAGEGRWSHLVRIRATSWESWDVTPGVWPRSSFPGPPTQHLLTELTRTTWTLSGTTWGKRLKCKRVCVQSSLGEEGRQKGRHGFLREAKLNY